MKSKPAMPDFDGLRAFDSCVTFGEFAGRAGCLTRDNIIAWLDRYHIAEALVHEQHARCIFPREHGNRRLLKAIKGLRRIHPVWILDPPAQPGRGQAERTIREMLACGVRAARLCLKQMPPMLWVWDDLLSALEAHRVPCFLDFGPRESTWGDTSNGDVDGIRDFALAHPKLPLVVSHVMGGLGVHPAIVPLIRRTPNVYLDIAGILEFWRVVAGEVGPERVLFATCAPFVDTGVLVSNIQYMHGFTAADKKLMCGGNLRRLLEAVE